MSKLIRVIIIICPVIIVSLFLWTIIDNPDKNNDTVLYFGGDIVTMEKDEGSTAEAVVTEQDRISFVGDLVDAKRKYPDARQHNLMGRTLFPGLIEQHLHSLFGALALGFTVIAPEDWILPDMEWPAAKGAEEYKSMLKALSDDMDSPVSPLVSWGYSSYFHGNITRDLLDEISKERPIFVWHRSCREFTINSAAIAMLDINQSDISSMGETIEYQINLEAGHFMESGALLYLFPKFLQEIANEEVLKTSLKQMVKMLHNSGITAFNEPGAIILPEHAAIYQEVLGDSTTPFYSFFIPETKIAINNNRSEGEEAVFNAISEHKDIFPEKGKIRFFNKQAKISMDGSAISQLMQMRDGYLDGHEGQWIQPPAEVAELFTILWKKDYQLHIHVNGDYALERLLNIIESNISKNPRSDHRTTIVHFMNSTDAQVQKLSDLKCIISANPYYVTAFGNVFSKQGLGPDRAQNMVRLAPAEKLGIPISLHSGLPVAPSHPLFTAWAAITRKTLDGNILNKKLALSRHAALKAITINAAQSWRMEDELGSISEGKIANFTILEENPYKVPIDHLKDIQIAATVFEGKAYPIAQSSVLQ